jgi:hypothetical protein
MVEGVGWVGLSQWLRLLAIFLVDLELHPLLLALLYVLAKVHSRLVRLYLGKNEDEANETWWSLFETTLNV